MNYHNITKDDMLNGDGLRTVLWVSGCNHHCDECQNPQTWDIDSGIHFGVEDEKELFSYLDKDYCSGITFSGGDPLHPANRNVVARLCRRFRYRYDNIKTIWIYTGYLWEDVKDLPIMDYVDVLVDGPYMKQLRDVTAEWVGSTNQRVIDVQASLVLERVVLYEKKK